MKCLLGHDWEILAQKTKTDEWRIFRVCMKCNKVEIMYDDEWIDMLKYENMELRKEKARKILTNRLFNN